MTLDYMPAFMQACFGDSPVQAGGLHALGMTLTIGPIGVIAGVAVKVFKLYRPPIALGWTLSLIGLGTLTTLNADSSTARLIGIEIVLGVRTCLLFSAIIRSHLCSRAGWAFCSPPPISQVSRATLLDKML